MRLDIVESVNDCKTIHEAYWEAIRVERILKWSPLEKVTLQEGKSSHLTTYHVELPVAEDMLTEKPEQDTSMGNGGIQATREEA